GSLFYRLIHRISTIYDYSPGINIRRSFFRTCRQPIRQSMRRFVQPTSHFLIGERFLRHDEDLSRPDQVWIADLIAIGKIDRRITRAMAIGAPGYGPEIVTAADDDRAFDLLQRGRGCGVFGL